MTKSLTVRSLLAMGATVLLIVPVAAASGGLPKAPSYSGLYSKGDLQVRPTTIAYTVDDSGFFTGRQKGHGYAPLRWSSWTSTSAKGSGFDWVDNCRPSCASGTLHSYPVRMKLWRPRAEGEHLIFTRMTVTYTGKKPTQAPEQWKVTHTGKNYFWTFHTR